MKKENQLIKKLSTLEDNESKELLKSLIKDALAEDNKETLSIEEKVKRLKECKKSLTINYNFKEGDIVMWKPHLGNRSNPNKDEPAIVLEILENPILDTEEDTGSPYFGEQLDIILGVIMDDGVFISFYSNKSRFQPFKRK